VFAEVFATEDVKVSVPGLITEVACDVGRLNQLDQRVPGLVPFTEMLDTRFPIGFHIDSFDELNCESVNVRL